MTIAVSPVANSQTFGAWLTTTNRLANLMSQNTVTADSSSGGSVTTGNSYVNGYFGATYLVVGSTLDSNAALTITTPNATAVSNGSFYLNANGSWSRAITSAGGSNTQVQFNSSNGFAGSNSFTFNTSTTRLTVGNTTVNSAVTPATVSLANATVSFTLNLPTANQYSNGTFYLNANGSWAEVSGGAGYYKGNAGVAGKPENIQNLFRINANTMTANITIAAGENAQVTGPLAIASGVVLTIDSGGRVAVI